MFDPLPEKATELAGWSWAEFEPYFSDLANRELNTHSLQDFLSDWTRVSELLDETFSRLHVATTIDTADNEAEQRYHNFLDRIYPRAEQAEQQLKQKLLAFGVVPPGFEVPQSKMRAEAELFRERNLPLYVEEHKLSSEYDKIIGSQTVHWDGQEMTVVQLKPVFQNADPTLREGAWRAALRRQLEDRNAIGDLWRKFMAVRLDLSANAGFGDYRSFRWKQMQRFDYHPSDCMRFHEAIEQEVVPVAVRICERRRKLLGLETLRPWDLEVDPMGRPPLVPFQDVSELMTGASSVFHRIDPVLGSHFDTMIREKLLDLDNRKNKAPGGYCTEFASAKRPFIFMNAVGVHDDVQTILHEAGHAFHAFERAHLPYYQQRQVNMEFSEVASMAMEFLASPYLTRAEGGFYSEADRARAVCEHLERSILFWPYMAVVDAFQHWVYEHPSESVNPANCDAYWATMWRRFIPWIDWSGLEDELMTGWQRKLHIHTVPFYYVEYGLAQLGAAQVWRKALSDQAAAVAAYRNALALGGTVALPALYAAAGAEFSFNPAVLRAAVSLLNDKIDAAHQVAE
ncbi:MAG TPA: M3 family oligoendopeptidase [Desulfomonilaceae bacterium]|nr:M3 family oligoendopeptidase [Desulfomonilaceae bacterium]